MKKISSISRLLISILVLGLICGGATALSQPGRPALEGLAPLKAALQAADAPGLTTEQENSIQTLIAEFRNDHRPPAENSGFHSAHEVFTNAVLNEDIATATSQAVDIANSRTVKMAQREADAAVFAIKVVAILKERFSVDSSSIS